MSEMHFVTDQETIKKLGEFLEDLLWCKYHGQPATYVRKDRCKVHLFALVPKCDVVEVGVWTRNGS